MVTGTVQLLFILVPQDVVHYEGVTYLYDLLH